MSAPAGSAQGFRQRRRAYDVAKHLTISEAVTICRLAREIVRDFDAMKDNPSDANVRYFTAQIESLRAILEAPR